MIYELRTYTLKPGGAPAAAANSGGVGRDIRGNDYGKLEGYWMTEIGPLNQVMHLWSYADLNERAHLRAELSKNERWRTEYIPLIMPLLVRQDIRLLNALVEPKAPASEGNLYEFRHYRLAPGAFGKWYELFKGILPVREKYSKIAGLWHTEAGQPNEICHIWPYPSFEARMEARNATAADPEWQAFLKAGAGLIEEQHSTLMWPADHSPLK